MGTKSGAKALLFTFLFQAITAFSADAPKPGGKLSCAVGPHAAFKKLVARAEGLPNEFAGERVRPKLVIDPERIAADEKAKDAAYAKEYYSGRDHVALAPPDAKANALPIFDSIDVLNGIHALDLTGKLTPAQQALLSDLLRARAHGKYDWKQWSLDKLDPNGVLKPLGLTEQRLDAALVDATTLETREGVRILPVRKEGEKGYISPGNVPSGPMLFFQGNKPVQEKTTELVNLAVQRLFTPLEGEKTGGGIMFLSDVHAGRATGEEGNFLAMADVLANHPPKKIIFGGDLLDAPSTGRLLELMNEVIAGKKESSLMGESDRNIFNEIIAERGGTRKGEPLSYPEQNLYRAKKFKFLLDYLSSKVPNTEIIIQFGNHDLARLSTLPRRKGSANGEIFGVGVAVTEIPQIALNDKGMLPKDWDKHFKADLQKVLVAKGAKPVVFAQLARATPEEMVELARQFYELKGLNKNPQELSEFNYYDEKAADFIRDYIKDNKQLSFLGRRSDKYFKLNVGTAEKPVYIMVTHEPQDSGPNMDRVDPAKPSVFGGQTKWEDNIRAVVNFDRHAAATIASQSAVKAGTNVVEGEATADGKVLASKAFHVVGSFTGNSNPGQNMMAAIMETDADFGTGNLYHVTFAGGPGGKPTSPSKARYRQVQWVAPHLRIDAPPALGSTTNAPIANNGITEALRKQQADEKPRP